MTTAINNKHFSNLQIELLKTFNHHLNESELLSIKNMLADFFSKRLIDKGDTTWDNKNWSNEKMDNLLSSKTRKMK